MIVGEAGRSRRCRPSRAMPWPRRASTANGLAVDEARAGPARSRTWASWAMRRAGGRRGRVDGLIGSASAPAEVEGHGQGREDDGIPQLHGPSDVPGAGKFFPIRIPHARRRSQAGRPADEHEDGVRGNCHCSSGRFQHDADPSGRGERPPRGASFTFPLATSDFERGDVPRLASLEPLAAVADA